MSAYVLRGKGAGGMMSTLAENAVVASLFVDRRTRCGRGSRSLSIEGATPVYKTCHPSHVLFCPLLLLLGQDITGDRL